MKSNPSIKEQLREVIGNALGYAVMNPDFTDDEIIDHTECKRDCRGMIKNDALSEIRSKWQTNQEDGE